MLHFLKQHVEAKVGNFLTLAVDHTWVIVLFWFADKGAVHTDSNLVIQLCTRRLCGIKCVVVT